MDNFQCESCHRIFEGSARDLCFACLATHTRKTLAALDEGTKLKPQKKTSASGVSKERQEIGFAREGEAAAVGSPKRPAVTKPREKKKEERLASAVKKGKPIQPSRPKKDIQTPARRAKMSPIFGEAARDAHLIAKNRPIRCGLCGTAVPPDEIKAHAIRDHGISPGSGVPRRREKKEIWVHIVSGGLPGLGKRR